MPLTRESILRDEAQPGIKAPAALFSVHVCKDNGLKHFSNFVKQLFFF